MRYLLPLVLMLLCSCARAQQPLTLTQFSDYRVRFLLYSNEFSGSAEQRAEILAQVLAIYRLNDIQLNIEGVQERDVESLPETCRSAATQADIIPRGGDCYRAIRLAIRNEEMVDRGLINAALIPTMEAEGSRWFFGLSLLGTHLEELSLSLTWGSPLNSRNEDYSLLTAAIIVHEIGHALGLRHNGLEPNLMHPNIAGELRATGDLRYLEFTDFQKNLLIVRRAAWIAEQQANCRKIARKRIRARKQWVRNTGRNVNKKVLTKRRSQIEKNCRKGIVEN